MGWRKAQVPSSLWAGGLSSDGTFKAKAADAWRKDIRLRRLAMDGGVLARAAHCRMWQGGLPPGQA